MICKYYTVPVLIVIFCAGFEDCQEMATWKVTDTGEYKPFFGYTIISMVNDPGNALKSIENFLSASTLSEYFAPLPHHTYHMTLYNTYTFKRDPIPAVQRWLLQENEKLPENGFLPANVLKNQHKLAMEAIHKHLDGNNLKIKKVDFVVSNVVKIRVSLDLGQEKLLKSLREDLAKIYEYADADLKFHVTLAYLFKKLPVEGDDYEKVKEELEKLKEMVQMFVDFELNKHSVYLFDSMINFMPIDSIVGLL